jgi:hypothetical protein
LQTNYTLLVPIAGQKSPSSEIFELLLSAGADVNEIDQVSLPLPLPRLLFSVLTSQRSMGTLCSWQSLALVILSYSLRCLPILSLIFAIAIRSMKQTLSSLTFLHPSLSLSISLSALSSSGRWVQCSSSSLSLWPSFHCQRIVCKRRRCQ